MNIAQLKLSQKKLLDNLVSRGYMKDVFIRMNNLQKSLSVQGDIQKRHWILG